MKAKPSILEIIRSEDIESLKVALAEVDKLYLSHGSITGAQVLLLAEVLKNNKTLTQLEFVFGWMGDAESAVIAVAIKSNTTLTHLNFSYHRIGVAGGVAISEALKSNNTLMRFNLGVNHIGAAGGVAIAEVLKSNGTLTRLSLGVNQIGATGSVAIAEALKSNNTLIRLDLWNNQIGNVGGVAIAEALKSNSTLTQLNLSYNHIRAAGSAAIAEALKSNSTLTQLNFWNNQIGDVGGAAIAEALKNHNTLAGLNLDYNKIEVTESAAIAEALKSSNTAMTRLSVVICNSIKISDQYTIMKAITRNEKLATIQEQVLATIQSDASDNIVIARKLLYQYQHFTSDLKIPVKNDSIDAYISKNYFKLIGVCKSANNRIENQNVQYGLLHLPTDIMQEILSYLWPHSLSLHLLQKEKEDVLMLGSLSKTLKSKTSKNVKAGCRVM